MKRLCSLLLLILFSFGDAFAPFLRRPNRCWRLGDNKPGKSSEKGGEGYKFGDFTRSFLNNVGQRVTGDGSYEFGQITKKVLQNATSAVVGKDVTDYQFGDLSRALVDKTGSVVTNYTGKADYEVGDISKEIIRRVSSGEYQLADVFLLCKILLSFGLGLTPIASALPAKVILEMINYGLAQEAGGRLMQVLAETLDKRMKESIMGDADYALGDKTKSAILSFIGKDSYSVGDITKRINELADEAKKKDGSGKGAGSNGFSIDPKLIAELYDWDKKAKIQQKS